MRSKKIKKVKEKKNSRNVYLSDKRNRDVDELFSSLIPWYAVDATWWLILAHPVPTEDGACYGQWQGHEQPNTQHLE